ncbi:helix-turn-helix domain-containing protein [Stenotrophomonas sp.]|uniref:helix-turn-helix domain-containing protein n=1 Tax=Stenotrophomonas sp. TaxID=69392 RepID=UPI0028AE9F24|nr:helix-turn-helix domain-containing protein [Stenotrophomonas sp.]
MATTPVQQQQRLAAARHRFAEGGELPAQLLAPALLRSWERSRQAGIRPQQAPQYAALAQRRLRLDAPLDRLLARCVRQDMDDLWAAFGGRRWTLFCVNRDGLIIAQREHGLADEPVLRPIQIGRRVREIEIGTTAPACTLAEAALMQVRGNEHYLDEFAAVYCLSVPLQGVDGEVLGALDITGIGERDSELLGGYFRQAALSVQNQLLHTLRDCHLLALQHDARWLGTPLQGLLAVHEDGQLRAANSVARRLLGLPRSGVLPPLSLSALFCHASVHQRRRLLQPGPVHRVPLRADNALQVQYLRAPVSAHGSTRGVAVAAVEAGSLRAQGAQAARAAVAAQGGNLSAAARQLGISRTTLYRKLQQGG